MTRSSLVPVERCAGVAGSGLGIASWSRPSTPLSGGPEGQREVARLVVGDRERSVGPSPS